MSSSSTHKAALQNLRKPPDVHIVFYNPAIQVTQVQCWRLYNYLILRKLRVDVVKAIIEHKADIIALSELGGVNTGLGRTLSTWKKSKSLSKENHIALCEKYFNPKSIIK